MDYMTKNIKEEVDVLKKDSVTKSDVKNTNKGKVESNTNGKFKSGVVQKLVEKVKLLKDEIKGKDEIKEKSTISLGELMQDIDNMSDSDIKNICDDIKKIDKLTTNENRIMVYSKLDTIRASLSNSNCKYNDKLVDLIDNINIRNSQLIRNTYLKNINGTITKILKGDLKYLGSKIDSLKNKDNLSVMQKIQLKLLKTEKNFTQKYLYPASINKPSSMNLKNISKMPHSADEN